MKKLICVLMCVVFLCGCTEKGSVKAVSDGISYRAHIFYFGKEYDCNVRICDSRAEYTVKGGLLDGFKSIYSDDGVILQCEDKKSRLYTTLPEGCMTGTLFEMNSYLKGEYETEKKDGEYIVKGYTSLGKFDLKLTKAGLPLSCYLNGEDFYVEFYDVSLIKEE